MKTLVWCSTSGRVGLLLAWQPYLANLVDARWRYGQQPPMNIPFWQLSRFIFGVLLNSVSQLCSNAFAEPDGNGPPGLCFDHGGERG